MKEFDLKAAQERATRRKSEGSLEDRLAFTNGISKVVDWCNKRNIKVYFCVGGEGQYIPQDGDIPTMIKIGTRFTIKNQLYILLHESGHHLCRISQERNRIFDWGGEGSNQLERAKIIEEEYEAWNRGLKLSKRLGIEIDQMDWEKFKARLLETYFRWAAEKGTRLHTPVDSF